SCGAALELIRGYRRLLDNLSREELAIAVRLSVLLEPEGPAFETESTLGRELAFVVSHTIHHGAIIASTVRMLGGEVPRHFGVAPSTIAWLERDRCAR